MTAIYRFHFACGRMGDLEGIFAVNDKGQKVLDDLMDTGRQVYFGEVLGKHSEIMGPIEDQDIALATGSEEEVAVVMRVFGVDFNDEGWATINGTNPLDYLNED